MGEWWASVLWVPVRLLWGRPTTKVRAPRCKLCLFGAHSHDVGTAQIIYLFSAWECSPGCYGDIDRGVLDNAFSEPSLRDLVVIRERSYEKSRRVLGEGEKGIPGRGVGTRSSPDARSVYRVYLDRMLVTQLYKRLGQTCWGNDLDQQASDLGRSSIGLPRSSDFSCDPQSRVQRWGLPIAASQSLPCIPVSLS